MKSGVALVFLTYLLFASSAAQAVESNGTSSDKARAMIVNACVGGYNDNPKKVDGFDADAYCGCVYDRLAENRNTTEVLKVFALLGQETKAGIQDGPGRKAVEGIATVCALQQADKGKDANQLVDAKKSRAPFIEECKQGFEKSPDTLNKFKSLDIELNVPTYCACIFDKLAPGHTNAQMTKIILSADGDGHGASQAEKDLMLDTSIACMVGDSD